MTQPNIILFLTDQQRHDAIGYINPLIKTPNLDKLATTSMICTHTFVQSPQCQPSRASILTGRYPTAHRVWWNETPLAPTELTIGNYLQEAGYNTAYFGKLHVDGPGNHHERLLRLGFSNASFLFEDWCQLIQPQSRLHTEFYGSMSTKTWTGEIIDRSMHHEDIITRKAIDWIHTTKRPFFITISYHGPHPPYAAPTEFNTLYNQKDMIIPPQHITNNGHTLTDAEWRNLKTQYYGSISWIDDNIGKILTTLTDDDIIIFTSDHGDILGDHGLFSKGLYAYDGNIRVPLLFKTNHRHGIYGHLIQSIDILPTLLDAVNIKKPLCIQGTSLMSAFQHNHMINRYVISMIGHRPRLRMIRTKFFKYWIYDTEHLYDLRNDPMENINLSADIKHHSLLGEARFGLLQALILAEDQVPYPRSV